MFTFKSLYFVIFTTLISWRTYAKISDKRSCADEKCSEIIAYGKTLVPYNSIEENILSFRPNEDVNIYSFGAGSNPSLLGVEIKGKRGYVNKDHIRETKRVKRPKYLIDTELVQNSVKSKPEMLAEMPLVGAASNIKADPSQQPFHIVDGTKIPIDLAELSTEGPIVTNSNVDGTESLYLVPENIVTNQPYEATTAVNPVEKHIDNLRQIQDDTHIDEEDDDDDNEEEEDGIVDDEENEELSNLKNSENEINQLPKSSNSSFSQNIVPIDDEADKAATSTNLNSNLLGKSEEEKLKDSSKEEVKSKEPVVNEFNIEAGKGSEITERLEQSKGTTNPQSEPQTDKVVTPDMVSNILESQSGTAAEDIHSLNLKEIRVNDSLPNIEIPVEVTTAPHSAKIDGETVPLDISKNYPTEEQINEINEKSNSVEADSSTLSPAQPLTTEMPFESNVGLYKDIDSVTPNPLELKNEHQEVPITTDAPDMEIFGKSSEIKRDEAPSGGILGGFFGSPRVPEVAQDTVSLENEDVNEGDGTYSNDVSNNNLEVMVNQTSNNDASNDSPIPPEVTVNHFGENADEKIKESALVSELSKDIVKDDEVKDSGEKVADEDQASSGGILSSVMSFFAWGSSDNSKTEENVVANEPLKADGLDHSKVAEINENVDAAPAVQKPSNVEAIDHPEEVLQVCDSKSEMCPQIAKSGYCDKESQDCPELKEDNASRRSGKIPKSYNVEDFQEIFIEAFSSDMFLYLSTTSLSVIVLIVIWILMDKCRREGPLIARINKLEQQLLATLKENEVLQEKASIYVEEKTRLVVDNVPNEVVDELNAKLAEMSRLKAALEEQVQALEKELDTSTEVGIELNKMISEMLNSADGSEILKENVEQMQKKVLEQQDTINTLDERIRLKETENYEIKLELEISNKKIADFQAEVDKMVEKILKIEEERDQQHKVLENEIAIYQNKCKEAATQENVMKNEIITLKQKSAELQRIADTKIKEYNSLKETLNTVKTVKDKDSLKIFLDVSEVKAQLEQIKSENLKYSDQLAQEREVNLSYIAQIQDLSEQVNNLKQKYENADKEKVEIQTKLEVLNNYFKEKEDQMQKEISKYESLWAAREGEATSTTERIRYMQEELQNFKTQNESLKQEIVNQEVELKSQISMLEKKAHENWMTNRQTERKLEEARQEAALLRNRLTIRERAIVEGNNKMRILSPLHQNGELPISPPPLDHTQSPPPLFNPRDHMTKSPPLPGMPPFLPPPLGATPFIPPPPLEGMMPPPLGDIGGMPPPPFIPGLHPGMFPGDHRPPPLGRMSSPPPVGGRYTPESTIYSEYDRYDRRSPSPPYDSEYGASPPPIRGYSPYNDRDRLRDDRREYKRPQPRSNGRNSKGLQSSGSENDSLGKINKKPQRKV